MPENPTVEARNCTPAVSLAALIAGFSMGFLAFLFDLPVFGETKWLTDRAGIPFMMQGWWSFVICSVIHVGVSLVTKPNPEAVARMEVGRFEMPPRVVVAMTAVMGVLLVVGYWFFE